MTGVRTPTGEVKIKRTVMEKVVFGAIGVVLTAFMGANVRSQLAESGRAEEVKTLRVDVSELKHEKAETNTLLREMNQRLSRIEGKLEK